MRSFRAKLTLWNLALLALGLVATSTALVLVTRAWAAATVDAELLRRAERAQGGRGQGFQPFDPSGQARMDPSDDMRGQPPRMGQGFGGGPAFADIRVPRVFRPDGTAVNELHGTPWDEALLARSAQGETVFKTIQSSGRPLRIVSLPLDSGNVVQAATDMAVFDSVSMAQFKTLAWLIPATLVLAGAAALFLTGRATRPIADLTQAASRIDETNLDQRLDVTGSDEFAALTSRFNEMIARLQNAVTGRDRTIEAQKRFAADASHELRTPLTRIKLVASAALEQGATPKELDHALRVVNKAADDMDHLVGQLLALARADASAGLLDVLPVQASELLDLATEVAGLGSDPRLTVSVSPKGLTLQADAQRLARAVANLLGNAARHTPADGTIILSAGLSGGTTFLRVADTGEGIAPEHLPHLTERFYRVDTARSRSQGGTGLGLSIVHETVSAHKGTLHFESEPGKGTVVEIRLPAGGKQSGPSKQNPNPGDPES